MSEQKFSIPFEYRDRQLGKILNAGESFEVIAIIDNYIAIKSELHSGFPLDATIFKMFAEKLPSSPKQ